MKYVIHTAIKKRGIQTKFRNIAKIIFEGSR